MLKKVLYLCVVVSLVFIMILPSIGHSAYTPNVVPDFVLMSVPEAQLRTIDGYWDLDVLWDRSEFHENITHYYIFRYMFYTETTPRAFRIASPYPIDFWVSTASGGYQTMYFGSNDSDKFRYSYASKTQDHEFTGSWAELADGTKHQLSSLCVEGQWALYEVELDPAPSVYAYINNDDVNDSIPTWDITDDPLGSDPYDIPSALYPPSWDLVPITVDPSYPVKVMLARTPAPTGTAWLKISSTLGGSDIQTFTSLEMFHGKQIDSILLSKHGSGAILEVLFTSDHYFMPSYSKHYGRTYINLASTYTAPSGKITSPPNHLLTSSDTITARGYVYSANPPYSTWLEYRVNSDSPTTIAVPLTVVGQTFSATIPLQEQTSSSVPIINYVELWTEELSGSTPLKLDTIQVVRSSGSPLYKPPDTELGQTDPTGLLSPDNLYNMGKGAISVIQQGLIFLGMMMQMTYSFLPLPIVLALSAICAFMIVPVLWKMWRG